MLYESETIESVFVAVRAAVAVSARRGAAMVPQRVAGDGVALLARRLSACLTDGVPRLTARSTP